MSYEPGHRAAAILSPDEILSLAYRHDGADHARYWLSDGVIARRLSSLDFNPPPLRYPPPDCGGDSLHQPPLLIPAAIPTHHVASRTLGRFGFRTLLYALLVAQPLVGWGMLSAARYPIVLYGSLHLFPILPHTVLLYAVLRTAHTVLAYLLLLTILSHFGAVLFHTWVLRDGTFSRMAPWRDRAHERP